MALGQCPCSNSMGLLTSTIGPSKTLKSFKEYVEHTSKIANAEGLTAHAISAEKRLKD